MHRNYREYKPYITSKFYYLCWWLNYFLTSEILPFLFWFTDIAQNLLTFLSQIFLISQNIIETFLKTYITAFWYFLTYE